MKLDIAKCPTNNEEIEEVIVGRKEEGARRLQHHFPSEMNLDAYSQSLNQVDQICSSVMMNNEDKGDLSRRVMDSDEDIDGRSQDDKRLDGDRQRGEIKDSDQCEMFKYVRLGKKLGEGAYGQVF